MTGAAVESDWPNLPAGLTLSAGSSLLRMRSLSRPSPDLYRACTQKKRVCVRACGLAALSESVNVELQRLCELWRLLENLSKAF